MFFVVVFCVLSNLQTSLQQRAINVVKGKMATYCSGTTDKLTDEKLDTKISIVCTSAIFIEVDFGESYFVQYATIQCDNGDIEYHAFDYFDVELHSRQEQKLCGSYHAFIATHTPEANVFRVNCKRYREKFNKVTFKGESSEIFTADVSEVAVYAFSSSTNPAQPFIYIGCFARVNIMELFDYESIHQCSQVCIERNYVVMAIMEPIKWCVCGINVYRMNITSIHECDIPCEERYYSCGAVTRYSVYLLDFKLPSIEVCTGINTSLHNIIRGGDHPQFDRSIQKCISDCDEYNYAFMANGWCTCTNKTIDSVYRENCNITCAKREPGEYCGSGYVLFSTCLSPDFRYLGCRDLLRCSAIDMYGVCQGPCFSTGFDGQDNEPAYIGPHCIGYDRIEFQSNANATMEQETIDVTSTQEPRTQESPTQEGQKESKNGTGYIGGSESIVRVVVAFIACFFVGII